MSMWEPLKSIVDRMPAEGEDVSQALMGPPCRTCKNWQPRVEYMDLSVTGRHERIFEGIRCCVSVDMYHDFSCYKPLEMKVQEQPEPASEMVKDILENLGVPSLEDIRRDAQRTTGEFIPLGAQEKAPHPATCQVTGGCVECSREVREERQVSEGVEQYQSFAHDARVTGEPDDECRRCHRKGYKLDEFTSPYTGLCRVCSEIERKVPASLQQPLPESLVQPRLKPPYESFQWCGQLRYRCNKLWPQSQTSCGFDTHDELLMLEHIRSVHKTPKPVAAAMMPTLFDAEGQEIHKVNVTTHGDEEPQFQYVFADEKR